MRCFEVRERICGFVDGELDAATRRDVQVHLDGCPGCLEVLRDLKRVDAMVHGLTRLEPGPDFTARAVDAIMGGSDAVREEADSRPLRARQALTLLLEALASLWEAPPRSTRTLDEFSDCPPLSMSHVYFSLLEPGGRGCCDELSL